MEGFLHILKSENFLNSLKTNEIRYAEEIAWLIQGRSKARKGTNAWDGLANIGRE